MNSNQENSGFSYTYSAKEQAEVKKIREKYTSPSDSEDKMVRLRRLDANVTGSAQAAALAIGVIGALILGFGMSLCITDLGSVFGLAKTLSLVIGIIIGVIGGVLACLAYPVYQKIIACKRKKLAPEILRLCDELMK